MSKRPNSMDIESLLEEIGELQFKLAMVHYAEQYGKELLQENEDLKAKASLIDQPSSDPELNR